MSLRVEIWGNPVLWGGRLISSRNDFNIREIESVISQVKGVLSSKVVCEDHDIVEIHVLADHSRTPKQIVRDIESAVLVKLGTPLDHKQISVVQLGEAGKTIPIPGPALQLQRINCSAGNEEIEVMVTINPGEEIFSATVSGPNTRQYRLRLAAEAALRSVEQYLGGGSKFLAADVQKIHIAGQEAIVAVISHCMGQDEDILPGIALNRGDEMEAAARATLDAVARRWRTAGRD